MREASWGSRCVVGAAIAALGCVGCGARTPLESGTGVGIGVDLGDGGAPSVGSLEDASADAGSEAGTPPDAATVVPMGSGVILSSLQLGPGQTTGARLEVVAHFSHAPPKALAGGVLATDGCSVTADGACFFGCAHPLDPSALTAGTLEIASPGLPMPAIVPPDLQDPYAPYIAFLPGSWTPPAPAISVSATGGDVPAFGPQSIVMPGKVTLTSPTPVGGSIMVETGLDFSLTWSGGEPGAIVWVSGSVQTEFDCFWDATAGQATIPQEAMAGLVYPYFDSALTIGQVTTRTFEAGGYAIATTARILVSHPAVYF